MILTTPLMILMSLMPMTQEMLVNQTLLNLTMLTLELVRMERVAETLCQIPTPAAVVMEADLTMLSRMMASTAASGVTPSHLSRLNTSSTGQERTSWPVQPENVCWIFGLVTLWLLSRQLEELLSTVLASTCTSMCAMVAPLLRRALLSNSQETGL